MNVYRYELGENDTLIVDLSSGESVEIIDDGDLMPLVTHRDMSGYETPLQERN
jgi:hypothetical protein